MKTLCSLLVAAVIVLSAGHISAQQKDDLELRAKQAHINTLNQQRLNYEGKMIELSLRLQESNKANDQLRKQIEKLKEQIKANAQVATPDEMDKTLKKQKDEKSKAPGSP